MLSRYFISITSHSHLLVTCEKSSLLNVLIDLPAPDDFFFKYIFRLYWRRLVVSYFFYGLISSIVLVLQCFLSVFSLYKCLIYIEVFTIKASISVISDGLVFATTGS